MVASSSPATSTSNPTINEPASSLQTPSPTSLANSSPESSSSSNLYVSSRPQSQNSSQTSQSEPPSPQDGQSGIPDSITPQDGIELPSLTPPTLRPPSLSVTPPANYPVSQNNPPRSVPPPSPTNTTQGSQGTQISYASWLSSLPTKIHERRWLENTIGVLGVAVAIWLGVRGYKVAVWQSWNDLRQTCATYKQSNISLGTRCTKILEGDPPGPPYWLHKWASHAPNTMASRVVRRRFDKIFELAPGYSPSGFSPHVAAPATYQNYPNVPPFVIIITVALVAGSLLLWKARGKSRDEEVFTSAARGNSNVHLTRHPDDGPETISGQGVVIKQKPDDEHYPGEVRRRLRSSVDADDQDESSIAKRSWSVHHDSVETLVAPTTELRAPSISLHDRSANEKHEGLIELDVNGHQKAFFKPSTGEFFHIPKWKHVHSHDESSSHEDRVKTTAVESNSTHRALGQMVAGGAEWAVGEKVHQRLAERLG